MDSEAADIIEQYDQIYANSGNSMIPKEIAEMTDDELERTLKIASTEAKRNETEMRNLFRNYRRVSTEKNMVRK